MPALIIAATAAFALLSAPSFGALPPDLIGTLDVSQPATLRASRFTATNAGRYVVGDRVGGHNERRATVVVKAGGSLSFQMRVRPGLPLTIEFEEMYGRDTLVRGYSVLVDDAPVYFRTWQGCGAGAVHYFVQAPAIAKDTVTVKLVNRAEAPFAISRVWAFSDFPAYFDAGRMAVPFYVAPLFAPSFSDEAADITRLEAIKRSLGDHPNAKPAFTIAIAYASFGPVEVKRRIEYALNLAKASGMPVQMEFDTWWAQTPSGLDGAGGAWSDVRYNQVVYNATQRRYQLSVPNQWSSTPWLTTNNARLNAYKKRRMAEAMSFFRRALNAMDGRDFVLAVNLDNEPVYWANGNAGLGEDLLQADFNPATVAAAKRDGVKLNPRDGLSTVERKWLHANLARYNGIIADSVYAGLDTDPIRATETSVSVPDDLLRNNIFTQAMVGAPDLQYPMLNAAYPFWETAAPLHARAGGEWNGDSLVEREAILRQITLGRNAGTNAECGNNAADMKSIRPGYALAQRYVSLYNYPLDKMDVATADIRDLTQPFPAFVYQPVVREERFVDRAWMVRAVDHGGLQSGIIGNTAAMAIYPASTGKPGYITWALESPSGSWKSLSLELDGRAFNYGKTDPSVNVRVLAGPSKDPATMRELARFHDGGITPASRVDLTPAATGLKTVYVRVEFSAPTIPPSVLSWCSIWKARFTTAWPDEYPAGAPQDESLATVRKQNLTVSWRRDAELAIAELAARHIGANAARAAYRRGGYAEAYHIANRALCTALPASFLVQSGRLSPYPIQVHSAAPVSVTVAACGPAKVRLRLRADEPTTARVRVGGLRKRARYTVLPDTGVWTIVFGSGLGSVLSSANGEIEFSTVVPGMPVPSTAKRLTGIYEAPAGQIGEFTLKGANGLETIHTNVLTTVMRGADGQPAKPADVSDLQYGDALAVDVGPDGRATKVSAHSETVEGVVKAFGQVTPFAMPYVALGSGRRLTISMDALVHTPGVDTRIKAVPLGSVDIKPGDRVRVRIGGLGRAFEVWVLQR